MQDTKLLKISFAIIGLALLSVIALFLFTSKSGFGERSIKKEDLGGDFTLNLQQGEISLSDFEGKVVVFYFGFLSCSEVCSNSMFMLSKALGKLSDTELQNIEVMMISIDPKRDTFAKFAAFSQHFHPKIMMGVTNNQESIDKITRQYGAYYNFTEVDENTDDYNIEHSSRYYVIDKTGKLADAMRHSTTAKNRLKYQIKVFSWKPIMAVENIARKRP